jgi:1,2-diacylglycerol 3-beta-galactosyltransferase
LCPGEFDVTLFDVWTAVSGWPWDRAVPAYRILGKRPWLWRLLWYGTAAWPGRVFGRWR